MITPRPVVADFAAAMEAKLRENDHKGGWMNDPPHMLFARVCDEMIELLDTLTPIPEQAESFAVARSHVAAAADAMRWFGPYAASRGTEDTGPESADVANMVMMVADVSKVRP